MSDVPLNFDTPPDQVTIEQIFSWYSALEMPRLALETQKQLPPLFRKFAEEIGGGQRTVASIKRVELRLWLDRNKERWPSAWTRKGKVLMIGRVFSFAVESDLTARNPFWRFRTDTPTIDTRPITPAEFQLLLRFSPVNFRQMLIFLRRTGARPGEAEKLKWDNLDLARGIAILKDHKTAKKTGKPRLIPLPQMIVKMLRWMDANRREPFVSTAMKLFDLLSAGPMRAFLVKRWQREHGISDRALNLARRTLGIRVAAQGRDLTAAYSLAGGRRPPCRPSPDHVFQNEDGGAWNRHSFSLQFRRIADRAGLPLEVRAYTLRHGFATDAIAGGVSLLLVSRMLGHSNTVITEKHYLHIAERIDLLKQAVEEAQQFLGNTNKKGGQS